ncbi:hypothetical protein JAAARDRAFT_638838 [Jaapia argillacea MUCL 33604]|uniref:Uncharacterized protein n=1 Tax=Jaapia argillacea MUCL 33604 TaxID=933084 RepID=A0A067PF03_9AGAM|nr:hypothetical protein JAAARDRAFT_638838 [Jaapia argillacea MUCL 33604]
MHEQFRDEALRCLQDLWRKGIRRTAPSIEARVRRLRVQDTTDHRRRFAAIQWMLLTSEGVANQELEVGLRPGRSIVLAKIIYLLSSILPTPLASIDPTFKRFREFERRMCDAGHDCHQSLHFHTDDLLRWHNFMLWLYGEIQFGEVCLNHITCSAPRPSSLPRFLAFPSDLESVSKRIDGTDCGTKHPGIMMAVIWWIAARQGTCILREFEEELDETFRILAETFSLELWEACENRWKQYLATAPPSMGFLPWVNSYPMKWRSDLADCDGPWYRDRAQSLVNKYFPRTSSPSLDPCFLDYHLKTLLGVVLWVAVRPRDKACDSFSGHPTLRERRWFSFAEELSHCFPDIPDSPLATSFTAEHELLNSTGHTCYGIVGKQNLDWYFSIRHFLAGEEWEVGFPGIDGVSDGGSCKICRELSSPFPRLLRTRPQEYSRGPGLSIPPPCPVSNPTNTSFSVAIAGESFSTITTTVGHPLYEPTQTDVDDVPHQLGRQNTSCVEAPDNPTPVGLEGFVSIIRNPCHSPRTRQRLLDEKLHELSEFARVNEVAIRISPTESDGPSTHLISPIDLSSSFQDVGPVSNEVEQVDEEHDSHVLSSSEDDIRDPE